MYPFRPRFLLVGLACLALLAGLAASGGSAAPSAGLQWVKLTRCDGERVGVRASIPGDGEASRMQVRLSLQWHDGRVWRSPAGQSASPWLAAGDGSYEWAQEGWDFAARPPPGRTVTLRGIAELQWLEGGRVTRSRTLIGPGCSLRGA